MPLVDYSDIESRLLRKFSWETHNVLPISEIPFQMFVYRVVEKEKISSSPKDTSDSGSDKASVSGDENMTTPEDPSPPVTERKFYLHPKL